MGRPGHFEIDRVQACLFHSCHLPARPRWDGHGIGAAIADQYRYSAKALPGVIGVFEATRNGRQSSPLVGVFFA